ncbi:uncharacterized protein TRUGW13939_10153 [Talaromyces rugulosus]|uniref:CFEM domain-containing protein n=1 Tax=Talaromyces rugulosus TaxID=121627 RepID=A0A7H8RBX5_TALRU|nr:uncharacterized protein TRUGW13939_10153 [Talaromyces rugulosus]QKX62985.1 hypothetical protein TRUGW13939_10153 [Talaromyces rugulosus]
MRSFISVLALVAAATATNMGAMDEAQTCAMKTLLSSSACNTGDAACLCSDSAREAVMGEINAACGAAQSEQTMQLASDACSKQKMRRAYAPSGTAEHGVMASPSASASAARMNGAQEGSSNEACSCAAKGPEGVDGDDDGDDDGYPFDLDDDDDDDDDERTGMTGTTNGRVHASSSMAAMATPSSSAARHAGMATTTPSVSSHAARPSGADAFSPFQGAGVQMVPSMNIVVGGVLAGVVGVFAAL